MLGLICDNRLPIKNVFYTPENHTDKTEMKNKTMKDTADVANNKLNSSS